MMVPADCVFRGRPAQGRWPGRDGERPGAPGDGGGYVVPMRENQPVVPGLLMIVAAWLAVVALAGCDDRGIEEMEAPAGVERPPLDSGGAPRAAAMDRAGVDEVDRAAPPAAEGAASSGWPLPAGWRVSPVEAPMRLATFLAEPEAGDADDGDGPVTVTLSRFPGRVGGVAANVNRWRAQIGLPEIDQAELEEYISPLDVGSSQGVFVELVGPEDASPRQAILGAIVIRGEKAWYFKLRGDAKLALREKEAFRDFLKSVEFK